MSDIKDAEQIKEAIEARGIKRLLHFTQLSNLESILENGLLTREQIEARGLKSAFSDNKRLDKYPNVTCCCSIEFPNNKMLYVTKQKYGEATWVIIEISTDILLQTECAFYPMNAAKSDVRYGDMNNFKGIVAFESMFEERPKWTREFTKLPEHYTTNPQAEVLVFDQIEPKHISGVYTDDKNIADEWNAKKLGIEFFVRGDLFDNRHDWKFWRY